MSDEKPDSANQCVCRGAEMAVTDTEDYFVFDRTGTPHVVVAVQPDNPEEVKQLCFFGYGGAIGLPEKPT